MFKKKSKGFTLIELLVVIAIIGILATIVLVSLNSARQKARDTRRVSDIRQVALALEMYYDDHTSSGYPAAANCNNTNWTGALATALAPTYVTVLPADPVDSGSNVYMYSGTATDYILYAYLENVNNSALTGSLHGTVMGCNCATPAYCLQP